MAEGKEDEELLLNGCEVSVWSDEKVLEIDSGNAAQHYECNVTEVYT